MDHTTTAPDDMTLAEMLEVTACGSTPHPSQHERAGPRVHQTGSTGLSGRVLWVGVLLVSSNP